MKILANNELIHVSGGGDPTSVPGATVTYWGGEANRGRPPEDTSLLDWATIALAAGLATWLILTRP